MMENVEDMQDIVTVENLGSTPKQLYFFPGIIFMILLYFNYVGITLPDGYTSALLGVSIVSALIVTGFIFAGLITENFYTIRTRAQTIIGEMLIAGLSLISSQIMLYLLGAYDKWFPDWNIVKWFIFGWFVYQIMWQIFKFFYRQKPFGQSNSANIFIGLILTILAGIVPIYLTISFGWM